MGKLEYQLGNKSSDWNRVPLLNSPYGHSYSQKKTHTHNTNLHWITCTHRVCDRYRHNFRSWSVSAIGKTKKASSPVRHSYPAPQTTAAIAWFFLICEFLRAHITVPVSTLTSCPLVYHQAWWPPWPWQLNLHMSERAIFLIQWCLFWVSDTEPAPNWTRPWICCYMPNWCC